MASTNAMLKKCSGLIDTRDVTELENSFLKNVWKRSEEGTHPERLSERQLDWLVDLHEKHFGDA